MNFTPGTPLDGKVVKHKKNYFESKRRQKQQLVGEHPRKKGRPKGSKNRLKGKIHRKKSTSNVKARKVIRSKVNKPRKASMWDKINSGIRTSGQKTTTTTTTTGTDTGGTPIIPVQEIQTTRPVELVPIALTAAPTEAQVIEVTAVPLTEDVPLPQEDDQPPMTTTTEPVPIPTTTLQSPVESTELIPNSTASPTVAMQPEWTSAQTASPELVPPYKPKPKSVDIPSFGSPPLPGLSPPEQTMPMPTANEALQQETSPVVVHSRPKSVEIPDFDAALNAALETAPQPTGTSQPGQPVQVTATNDTSVIRVPSPSGKPEPRVEIVPQEDIVLPNVQDTTTLATDETTANVEQADQDAVIVPPALPDAFEPTANEADNPASPSPTNPEQAKCNVM